MSGETVTKRLHLGGLTPSITTTHIKDRFASFGKVSAVETLQPDALGQPRPFAYLTIDTTPAQLKKCLNIMSGSMWRGTQLRIAEAKASYQTRLERECNPPAAEVELRAKKRQKRKRTTNAVAGIGKEAQDMRTPTADNCKSKKFWQVDSSNHLIRPLALRPSHPLPPLPSALSSSSRPRAPPTRARRRVINPAKWDPTHFSESSLAGDSSVTDGEWTWEEAGTEDSTREGEPNDGSEEDVRVIGRWIKSVNGEITDEQVVKGRKRAIADVEEESEYEYEVSDAGSDLFGRRARSASRSTSPLFARLGDVAMQESTTVNTPAESEDDGQPEENTQDISDDLAPGSPLSAARPLIAERPRSTSPLFASRRRVDGANAGETPSEPSSSEPADGAGALGTSASSPAPSQSFSLASSAPSATRSTSRSPSPLSAARSNPASLKVAPASSARNTHTAVTRPKVAVPDPLRKQVLHEKTRDMSLLDSILTGSAVDAAAEITHKNDAFEGFNESDDDEEFFATLRLRGGAPDESDEDENMSDSSSGSSSGSSSSSSSDSDSEDGSDSDSDSGSDASHNDHANQTVAVAANGADPSRSTGLKDMFNPTASKASFSLMANLGADIELDELDIPLAPALRRNEEELAPLEPIQPGQSVQGLFDPSPDIPLFFPPPAGAAGVSRRGKDAYAEDMAAESWEPFWRKETDDEMKAIWARDKLELTREWKKRHREAKKHRKRRGGADEVE